MLLQWSSQSAQRTHIKQSRYTDLQIGVLMTLTAAGIRSEAQLVHQYVAGFVHYIR